MHLTEFVFRLCCSVLVVVEKKAFGVHHKDGGFLFSKFKCIFQVVGNILKVFCEVKLQLWRWNCCFDLVFNGGFSSLLDSRPHMFCLFLCVSLFPCLSSHLHGLHSSGLGKDLYIIVMVLPSPVLFLSHTEKNKSCGLTPKSLRQLYCSKLSPHISHITRWHHDWISLHFIIVIQWKKDLGVHSSPACGGLTHLTVSLCCFSYQSSWTQTCYYTTLSEANTLRPEQMKSKRNHHCSQNCVV